MSGDRSTTGRERSLAREGVERIVRAPGKAMLFGEYAVLAGAPALVAAVDRYATVRCASPAPAAMQHGLPAGSQASPDSPFVREARRAAAMHDGSIARAVLRVDSAPLKADGGAGRKLGLGSSAAVVAAVVGLVDGLSRQEAWRVAQAAHATAQGARGSGADLAAAIWGGVIVFRPPTDEAGAPAVQAVALSPDLDVTLVDAGQPASTADRLARLAALREERPAEHDRLLAPLASLAAFVCTDAVARGHVDARALDAWNDALCALQQAIGLPILTPAIRDAAAAARACGGGAKPSGAGGGDLAVCFTPAAERARLRVELAARGLAPLDVHVGARGVHHLDAERVTTEP